MSEGSTKLAIVPPITPTDDAKAKRREVFMAIEEAYNEARKCYNVGPRGQYTDATIAADVGCAAALVTKVREEFFGPAMSSEPPELKPMQETLAYLLKEAAQMEIQAKGLGQQSRTLRKQAEDMEVALAALCKEFGWGH